MSVNLFLLRGSVQLRHTLDITWKCYHMLVVFLLLTQVP